MNHGNRASEPAAQGHDGDAAAASRRLRLGVVSNEFFDPALGRMGGFGWAARQVARCFNDDPGSGVEVVFVSGQRSRAGEGFAHGTRILTRRRGGRGRAWIEFARRLRRERLDLLLTIDYRPDYRRVLRALPRKPVIVWVRDPRPPEDVRKVSTLRLPGREEVVPAGIASVDCTSLAWVARASRWMRRRLLVATVASFLDAKVPATYGFTPNEVFHLPNIVRPRAAVVDKSARPSVVFLGRLDPIKRPWLFMELARRFPAIEFRLLGEVHTAGEGVWVPDGLPENVRWLGHVEGAEKERTLASSWVLVNTSIHESMAVSFLEALSLETPILSFEDAGGLVSRFGISAGRWDGTGLAGVPALASGLERLLGDHRARRQLGRDGRRWVEETHSRARFLEAFADLRARAGR